MNHNHRIFVSVENNAYCGWQSKLFYFSAVTRLNHQPTFMVHDSGNNWHPDFHDLVRAGAKVRAAPSYTESIHDHYAPRNTAGTLIHAAEMCGPDDLIVLCDADLIFLGPPHFPSSLSGNYYSYMDYDGEEVLAAAKKFKVKKAALDKQKEELRCGVPYVVPAPIARRLGQTWLKAVDAFWPRSWIDIMHAFGLAVVKLGLRSVRTDFVDVDYRPDARIRHKIIHYCYGDEKWEKRAFFADEMAKEVWFPKIVARKGTIRAEIFSQLREARDFYENALLTSSLKK